MQTISNSNNTALGGKSTKKHARERGREGGRGRGERVFSTCIIVLNEVQNHKRREKRAIVC